MLRWRGRALCGWAGAMLALVGICSPAEGRSSGTIVLSAGGSYGGPYVGLGVAVHGSSGGAAETAVDRLQAIRSAPNGSVQIELYSSSGFPARNEIAVLEIGGKEFLISQYPPNGDTRTLIFTLTSEEFAKLRDGDRVVFKYGRGEQVEKKDFGRLDKKRLDKDKK